MRVKDAIRYLSSLLIAEIKRLRVDDMIVVK